MVETFEVDEVGPWQHIFAKPLVKMLKIEFSDKEYIFYGFYSKK